MLLAGVPTVAFNYPNNDRVRVPLPPFLFRKRKMPSAHHMDNNRLIVVSKSREDFDLALKLAFRHAWGARGWWIYKPLPVAEDEYNYDGRIGLLGEEDSGPFLVLEQYEHQSMVKFPCNIDCETATEFAWKWLQEQEYGDEPDHDGSNSKGFVVFNESWGHVGHSHGAICAIGPAWAMHGK